MYSPLQRYNVNIIPRLLSRTITLGAQRWQRMEGRRKNGLRRGIVCLLLMIQGGLLGYAATQNSPTHLEPAFLASGVSHWKLGTFELYRVNPPLVRIVAALPVVIYGCNSDWSRFFDGPGSRAEFPVGEDFVKVNGPATVSMLVHARWACIPFSLAGGFVAYCWAKDLYGGAAGLLTLILYVFEPNLLAHGALITPDAACTAFGILAGYTFWRWLREPTWARAILAGGALGLAELTKMSWLILYVVWPLLWILWRNMVPESAIPTVAMRNRLGVIAGGDTKATILIAKPPFYQLVTILFVSVYLINLGYGFDGVGRKLKDFQFVSRMLAGSHRVNGSGNRFSMSWLGECEIPLPKQYILGFDSQKKDFEEIITKSYLRGEWRQGGWWYYYIYGLLVKVPCGTLGIIATAVLFCSFDRPKVVNFRDEIVVVFPAIVLFVLVSSQLQFNHHLRYVLPSLGLSLIFAGRIATCNRSSG